MCNDNLITKVTRMFQRADGSEARIVATATFGIGLQQSIGVYVHTRPSPEENWSLCNDRPHPDWKSMSVDEYVRRGRSEMLNAVSPGEILKVTSLIGTPMPAQ